MASKGCERTPDDSCCRAKDGPTPPNLAEYFGALWERRNDELGSPAAGRRRHGQIVSTRDEVLAAFSRLEAKTGRTTFALSEIIKEVQARGTTYSEGTLRTHIASRMCANAPDHHAVTFPDLLRTDRGQYRRTDASFRCGSAARGTSDTPAAAGRNTEMLDDMGLADALKQLSQQRPVFHSEADFQFALALQINMSHPELSVRLETRPIPTESKALDLHVTCGDYSLAVELKHLTRAIDVTVGDERFVLRNQGAHDVSAYDCCKDIARVEDFVARGVANVGYVVVLSNDPLYWKQPSRPGAGYDSFRLHEGRRLEGSLIWGDSAGPGTRKGREEAISLRNEYILSWSDYSELPGSNGKFRVLVVPVH